MYDKYEVGKYLDEKIRSSYFKTRRKFCIGLLNYYGYDIDDASINNLNNKMTQIVKGKKNIQVEDLPAITSLLNITCEELLSAGETIAPQLNRITNYEIARSNSRSEWKHYIAQEDKAFLNCDEFGNTILDYAFQFKNYKLIKFLMDEGYVWFVSDGTAMDRLNHGFGAGTSIKRRTTGDIDSALPNQLEYEDRLRTQTIALAIANNDLEVLDELHAREIPELYAISLGGNTLRNFKRYRNESLIRELAKARKEVLVYFSTEFEITNVHNYTYTYIFPFIGDVINEMIMNQRNNNKQVAFLLERAIQHNKNVYKNISELLNAGYLLACDSLDFDIDEKKDKGLINKLKSRERDAIEFGEANGIVSYRYIDFVDGFKLYRNTASNIVHVTANPKDQKIKELVTALNDWYNRIVERKF